MIGLKEEADDARMPLMPKRLRGGTDSHAHGHLK